jgi:hypothetical protein
VIKDNKKTTVKQEKKVEEKNGTKKVTKNEKKEEVILVEAPEGFKNQKGKLPSHKSSTHKVE